MEDTIDKMLADKYSLRFGTMAIDMGFVTIEHVLSALIEQAMDNVFKKHHIPIGEIMHMKGWMTREQIEIVLNKLSKDEKRKKIA